MNEILPVNDESTSETLTSNDQLKDEQNQIKIFKKRKDFPIELAFFFYYIAFSLANATLTNQLVYQTCHVMLGYNESDCSKLGSMDEHNVTDDIKNLETKVQPYAASIQMAKSMIENVIPAVLSFFIGPWSDKFGRKPVILLSMFGFVLLNASNTIVSIFSSYFNVNPWFYLVGSVCVAFTGGNCVLFIGMFAYVADITTAENRDRRMGLLEAAVYIGVFLGSISNSYVLKWTNSSAVFGISFGFVLFTFFYILFGVQESLQAKHQLPITTKIRQLFRLDSLIELFVTCFKRRQNFDRAIILLVVSSLVANIFDLNGTIPIYFLFFREKLGWTIKDYTFYVAASILIQFLGSILSSYCILKIISGGTLAVLGNISFGLNSLVLAFGRTTTQMYIGISVSCLRAVVAPMTKALLSKSVAPNEVGKVFSLSTSLESLTPLVAAPLYTLVYNKTLENYPGAFNFISVGIYCYCILALLIAMYLRKKYSVTSFDSKIS